MPKSRGEFGPKGEWKPILSAIQAILATKDTQLLTLIFSSIGLKMADFSVFVSWKDMQ